MGQPACGGWLHNLVRRRKNFSRISDLACVLPGKVRSAPALVGMTSLLSAPAGRAENPGNDAVVGRDLEGVNACAQLALTINCGARLESAHSVF